MLSRDPSCVRDMLWRIRFAAPVDLTCLGRALVSRGWQDRSRLPLLLDLHAPEGHALVLVPRTGRVQLRLHYLTSQDRRPDEAARLHAYVEAVAAELRGRPG